MAYLDQMNVKANESDTVGTDYDLRDKDLNAAAATTSVGSTQNIVLKGTDGSYHTIDKSSFTEAVRGVLGGILNNMTSKGTAVKGVGVIDNSNDFGLTTPSDLASVLGESHSYESDMNDLKTSGLYVCGYNATNKPTVGVLYYVDVQLYIIGNQRVVRQIAGRADSNGIYERWFADNTWTSWKILLYDIPTFYKNYSDLASLASALGGFLGCKTLTGNATYGEEVAFNSGLRAHIDMIQVSSNVFAVFAVGISSIEKIVDGFGLTSTTKDTPNKYNIYSQNGTLYIQNLYSEEATDDVNIVTVGVV